MKAETYWRPSIVQINTVPAVVAELVAAMEPTAGTVVVVGVVAVVHSMVQIPVGLDKIDDVAAADVDVDMVDDGEVDERNRDRSHIEMVVHVEPMEEEHCDSRQMEELEAVDHNLDSLQVLLPVALVVHMLVRLDPMIELVRIPHDGRRQVDCLMGWMMTDHDTHDTCHVDPILSQHGCLYVDRGQMMHGDEHDQDGWLDRVEEDARHHRQWLHRHRHRHRLVHHGPVNHPQDITAEPFVWQ